MRLSDRLKTPTRHLALALMGLASFASCIGDSGTATPEPARGAKAAKTTQKGSVIGESSEWIDIHLPEAASPGYTLVLYRRRLPMLLDMDGTVVHSWPAVRAVGRARILPSGNLAAIAESGRLEEYDWEGQLVWSYGLENEDTFLHHDFIQLDNGNYLLLAHEPSSSSDFLLEVNRSGEIVWRWDSSLHLAEEFNRAGSRNNKTHINSVHELPANRWFEKGRREFRPGNILVSARNLNTLYIVDRPGGEVVWRHDEGLDFQHEAIMIPPGLQGAGNILFFNNGYHDLDSYRQSAIVEVVPIDGKIAWEYRSRGFYSSTGGTEQALPNGNLLITSSQGGRVFELTRDGRIVWQWSPPFMPMRASRYPTDFNSHLEHLGQPFDETIERRDPNRFIDENLFTFSLPHQTRRVRVGDKTLDLLKSPDRCQILQIPDNAELTLGFGAWIEDQETPFVANEGPAEFSATIRAEDETEVVTLFQRRVERSDLKGSEQGDKVALLHEKIPLESWGSETVELCFALDSPDGRPGNFVWEEPLIRSPNRRGMLAADENLDEEALEKQEKHLKAIGYIN